MSSRPLLTPYPVITNGDMSQPTITSKVTIKLSISMISYQISWIGTAPVGSVVVQVSNDYSQNVDGSVRNPGSWDPISATTSSVSGGTGSGFIDVTSAAYATRLVYTSASGTGTLQATVKGQVS
jgi:hypothetical protein